MGRQKVQSPLKEYSMKWTIMQAGICCSNCGQRLLDSERRSLGFQTGLAKRLGPRNAGQAEALQGSLAKNQVTGRIPGLAGLDDDVDGIKIGQRNRPLFLYRQGNLDNHPAI